MKTAQYLSILIALQAGVLVSAAAVPAPIEAVTEAPAWSPKIEPGPKPAPGGDKRPLPPSRPCYPNPRICRGGF